MGYPAETRRPAPGGGPPALTASDDRFAAQGGGGATLSVPAPGVLANDRVDGQASSSLQAAVVDPPLHGSLVLRADGSLDYTPDPAWLGPDQFSYRAELGSASSPAAAVIIDVAGRLNVAPSFTAGPDQQVKRRKHEHDEHDDRAAHEVEQWATDVSPGAAEEAGQSLTFLVTVVSGSQVLAGTPTVSPAGTLMFEPSDLDGFAVVEIRLRDDGGTAGGGQDTSPPHTLVISVTR